MGTRKNHRAPVVDPTKKTVMEYVRGSLGEKADDFLTWAKEHQKIVDRPQTPERSERDAKWLLEDWTVQSANKEKWTEKLGELPDSLEEEPLTVGALHAYLTKLLALHPDVATVPVYHEECCGQCDSWLVEFDAEKDRLCIT
jgi:hypothetical protein